MNVASPNLADTSSPADTSLPDTQNLAKEENTARKIIRKSGRKLAELWSESSVAPAVEGDHWFGCDPVEWTDLEGKVVVIVFWSASCEVSLLRMRQLAEILDSDRTTDDVIVLGVHTPRFAKDEDLEFVADTIGRNQIRFPVVHDSLYTTWQRYNPYGWPSVAIVDRSGKATGLFAGGNNFDALDEAIAMALETPARPARRSEDSAQTSDKLKAQSDAAANFATGLVPDIGLGSGLAFPQGVASLSNGQVVIADTGHDRLLVGEISADQRQLLVSGIITDLAGPTTVAEAGPGVILLVERDRSAVSLIDLDQATAPRSRLSKSSQDSGAQGRTLVTDQLGCPTGVTVDLDGSVVITDAASDQIFRATHDREGQFTPTAIAGSGRAGSADGPAASAELAQPVAIIRTHAGLLFCDAASSNIRLLDDEGNIVNVTDGDFFTWGLVDGAAHRAKLQRPSGLCGLGDGSVLIADSGNDRIRLLSKRRISTLGVTGLGNPTAIADIGFGRVLVADTDHHRIAVLNIERQQAWDLSIIDADASNL